MQIPVDSNPTAKTPNKSPPSHSIPKTKSPIPPRSNNIAVPYPKPNPNPVASKQLCSPISKTEPQSCRVQTTMLSRIQYRTPIELPPSLKNASSPVACWRVIGNHKQEAVKGAGCLSAITFKSKKVNQNPHPTTTSKKTPTDLRVPAPQPPEPMISITRKQRVYLLT